MAINPQKFLPSAKSSSAIVKSSAPDISSQKNKGGVSIKAKKIDVNKLIPYKKEDVKGGALVNKEKTYDDITSKLVSIDNFLKSNLAGNKKTSEAESIQNKEEKSKEKEDKIESKEKPKGVSGISGISLPKFDFLESVKRYFLFTFLGWLFTNTKQYLPQLLKILDVLKPVAKAADFIFKSLLDGFIGFVDAGYDAYDKVKDVVKNIGGENAKKVFDDLSKNLNTLIATTVIVAGAIVTLGEKQKPPGKSKPSVAPRPKQPRSLTGKPDIRSPLRDRPRITGSGGGAAGSLDIRNPLRQKPRITIGGESKGLLRAVRPFLKRIPLPVVGALIDFGLSVALGESPGRAAFRAIGAGLLGAVGAAIGGPFAIFTGIGGGYLGDAAGGALYDTFFGGKNPNQKGNNQPVQKKASGGKVFAKKSSGNKPKPKRTIKLARKKPSRIPPQKSQPGKDIGGEKKIKALYPDPDPSRPIKSLDEWLAGDPGAETYPQYVERMKSGQQKQKIKPNPYKALTSTSAILKKIPLIGEIMGSSIDIALGQKMDRRVIKSFSSGLGYLVDSLANDKANLSAISLQRDLGGFADGGYVTPSRELKKSYDTLSSGDLISKIIGPNIEQKVTEALQNLQKELQKKPQKDTPETGPPDAGGGGGTAGGEYGGYTPSSGIQKEIYEYLTKVKKLSDIQALGLMANINRESSFVPGVQIIDRNGKPSGGLFQWNGGRFTAMVDKVPDWKTNWKGQVDWALNEPWIPGRNGKAYIAKSFSTAHIAADWWMNEWEVVADPVGDSKKHEAYLRSIPRGPSGSAKFREGSSGEGSSATSGVLDMSKLPPLPRTNTVPGKQHYGAPRERGRKHAGVDFDISGPNEKFYSRIGGVVVGNKFRFGDDGWAIDIYNKELGVYERIAEAQKILVGPGQTIRPGQPVAQGESTTGVIHYEIRKSIAGGFENSINPLDFLNNLQKNSNTETKPKPGQPPSLTPRDKIEIQQGSRTGTQLTKENNNINTSNMDVEEIIKAIKSIKTGQKLIFTGVGSVQGGKNTFGFPVTKYYDTKGGILTEPEFSARLKQSPIFNRIKQNRQGGGPLGSPNQRNYSSLSSYPSYDSGGGMMIAIQPIIMEKQIPIPTKGGGGMPLMFPSGNLNSKDTYASHSLSRG